MRGRILQYNGNDGRGIIVADGQQLPFTIANWKGEVAPAVGKTVECVVHDGAVQAVMLIGEDVLLKERTAELTGKLGTLVGGIASGVAARSGGSAPAIRGSVVERFGMPTLVACAAFLVGTTAFKAVKISMLGNSMGWSLFDLAGFLSQVGGGEGIKSMLVVSYIAIAIPFVWHDRRGWLFLLVPILAIGLAVAKAASAGGGDAPSDMFSFGILGFWLPALAALYLALTGFRKFATAR